MYRLGIYPLVVLGMMGFLALVYCYETLMGKLNPTGQAVITGLIIVSVVGFILSKIFKFIRHLSRRRKESNAYFEEMQNRFKVQNYQNAAVNLNALKQKDKMFKERQLLEYTENLLDKIFESREKVACEELRPLATDTMYELLAYQIEDLRENKHFEKYEVERRIGIQIKDYREDLQDAYIDVELKMGIMRGLYMQGTQKLVKGERNIPHEMTYTFTFIRKANVKTSSERIYETRCEGCGGVVSLMQGEYCPFCEAHITMGSSYWLLDNFEENSKYA